ncbi:MAG: FctA domain-containing protein [Coriobacteriaceae bacterium]|nr:FctA domain-containing protein [Coriobacteriaceae bacterium]
MNDSKNKHRACSIAQKAVAVLVCLAMASLQMPLVGSAFAESANAAATEQQQTEAPAQATDADAQTQPATPEADEKASASDEQAEEPEAATSTKSEAAPAAAAKAAPLRAPQAPAANTFPSAPPTSTFEASAFNKLPGGKLGVLANFGLVGFESIYGNTHTNSNIATETFYANSVTFGTNRLNEPEVSYIGTKVVGGASVNMKDGSGKYNGSSVVLGSGSKVEVLGDNPDSVRQVRVDGDHFDINGPSNAQEQKQSIYQEQAGQKYLDLASLQSQMGSVSREIASMGASGTTVDFNDQNNQKITIDKDAKVSVAKLTAADLDKWGGPRRIQVTGDYDTSVKRLIVIDIDAQGSPSITIPKVEVKGGSSGEVNTWANTNVIFNVYDSTVAGGQYRGLVTNSDATYGVILAPYGKVDAKSNVNGQIIANEIVINAEFHRDSFTYNDETITTGAALTVKGSKTLDGTAGNIPSFSFTMTAKGDAPMPTGSEDGSITVANSASGDINFGQITYSKAGTYEYTIAEVQDGKSGYDYDTQSYTMTVSVSVDNQASTSTKTVYKIDKVLSKSSGFGASNREVSPASGTDSTYNVATFANKTHKDLKTSYQIGGTKELSGRSFKPGDSWTFTLSAPEGTPLPQDKTVTVSPTQGTEQAFVFDSIEYGQGDIGKTYTYTVTESGSAAGVTNDADSHTVTVTIGKDDESGAPVVNAVYGNGADTSGNLLRFVNTYHASGWVDLAATKDISGRSFAQGDAWTFDVSCDDADAPMPAETSYTLHPTAGVNTQSFSFGHIDYTEKDAGKTYTYKVAETGDVAGVANDSAVHTMTVSVSDNGDGSLKIDRTFSDGNQMVFTNAYSAKGSIALAGTKNIEGRSFKSGDEMTFTLTGEDGAPLPADRSNSVTIKPDSGTSASFSFPEIDFTQEDAGKTYTYTVHESTKNMGNVQNDGDKTVTVSVADNGDGTLKVTPTYPGNADGLVFSNTYTASGSTDLMAYKTLAGRPFQAGDSWTFTVSCDDDAAPLPPQTSVTLNPQAGESSASVDFGTITYTQADIGKTYVYTVSESGDVDGVANDAREHTVTVSIADGGNGQLAISRSESDAGLNFVNAYSSQTDFELGGTKHLDNRAFAQGDSWNFTVSGVTEGDASVAAPLPENTQTSVEPSSGSDVDFSFGKIHYTQQDAGHTYVYTVTETGSVAGVDNDATVHTVTVKVNDDGKGNLTADATYSDGDALVFTNAYNAMGSYQLEATKNLVGRSFKTGDSWTFGVVAKDADAPLPANSTVTITPESGTSAVVDFGSIAFGTGDIGKTYTYSIIERGTIAGVTNDAQEHIVKLSVSDDDHDGKIEVTRTDEGAGTTFTNTYTAAGTFTMQAAKHLVGRDFQKGDHFTFVLSSTSANAPMPEKDTVEINPESGSEQGVYFGDINYTLADAGHQYTYRVDEAGSGAGITNDSDNHIVTVDVADAGDGTLTITPTYSDGGKGMEFTNKYQAAKCKATIQATKYLFGKYQTDGEFTFDLTDADGNVVQEQTNNANGEVTFDAIEYDTPGVYTYHISEVNSGEEDIEYDTHVEDVKVTVTEDKATAQLTSNVEYTSKDGSPDSATFANSYFKSEVNFEVAKMFHGSNASQDFTFKVVALDGGPLPVNDEVTVTAASGQKTPVKFDTITFDRSMADKTFRYQIVEENDGQSSVSYDATAFEAQVKVGSVMSGGTPTVTWSTVSNGVSSQVDASDLVFYNNQRIRLNARFMAMNRGHVSMEASKVRVEPTVHKELVGASLNSGEFTFELTGADENGQTIDKTATNDENGTVDFFTGDDMLTFTKPGTYAYQITEKAGDDSSISYDDRTITYTVVVAKDQQGSLYAQQSYTDSSLDDAVVVDPKFVNTELLNVRVQKTSREGGEGLYDALYGLYMENPDGSGNDALVGQASSDKDGWVTIKDVHPNFDAVYYFKEIKAPAGHTVDPYKTDRFMIVSNNGTYQLKYLDR